MSMIYQFLFRFEKILDGRKEMGLISGLFSLGIAGVVIWFWVLAFMALVRVNQVLELYIEKNK